MILLHGAADARASSRCKKSKARRAIKHARHFRAERTLAIANQVSAIKASDVEHPMLKMGNTDVRFRYRQRWHGSTPPSALASIAAMGIVPKRTGPFRIVLNLQLDNRVVSTKLSCSK